MTDVSIPRRWAAFWLDCAAIIVVVYLGSLGSSSIALFLWIALLGAYFPCFELAHGATPGQQLLAIRVAGRTTALSPRAVLRRCLPNVLETNPLLFGGILAGIVILLSRDRTRIGDKIGDTRVVRVGASEPRRRATPGGSRVILIALSAFLPVLAGLFYLKVALPEILALKAQAGEPLSLSFRMFLGALLAFNRYGFALAPVFFIPFLAGAVWVTSGRRKDGTSGVEGGPRAMAAPVTAEDLIGVWSADQMYGPGAQSDDVLVFKPDGTGYLEFINLRPSWADLFHWTVEAPGRLRLQGIKSLSVSEDGRSIEETPSGLAGAFDIQIGIEDTKAGRPMRVLRFSKRPWALNSDHYGFCRREITGMEAPDFSWNERSAP